MCYYNQDHESKTTRVITGEQKIPTSFVTSSDQFLVSTMIQLELIIYSALQYVISCTVKILHTS